jgi:hypothetical protein
MLFCDSKSLVSAEHWASLMVHPSMEIQTANHVFVPPPPPTWGDCLRQRTSSYHAFVRDSCILSHNQYGVQLLLTVSAREDVHNSDAS